ncbi:hypothetical protein SAMN05216573_1376 [Bradyrhizobium sp. Rc3b]|uniref:hypothetical protein n=1 Tax=Bradyrhizobium sp. Rc3b TaxID=1855322 RepID=UPI0008EB468A|nr:hypothetical protein [Bradyrhizobium sp. Rc3b]SFN97646.1 hypothetical protein SAMN05216573_1376 [Bradyrhizobium sp. Rc3b]
MIRFGELWELYASSIQRAPVMSRLYPRDLADKMISAIEAEGFSIPAVAEQTAASRGSISSSISAESIMSSVRDLAIAVPSTPSSSHVPRCAPLRSSSHWKPKPARTSLCPIKPSALQTLRQPSSPDGSTCLANASGPIVGSLKDPKARARRQWIRARRTLRGRRTRQGDDLLSSLAVRPEDKEFRALLDQGHAQDRERFVAKTIMSYGFPKRDATPTDVTAKEL